MSDEVWIERSAPGRPLYIMVRPANMRERSQSGEDLMPEIAAAMLEVSHVVASFERLMWFDGFLGTIGALFERCAASRGYLGVIAEEGGWGWRKTEVNGLDSLPVRFRAKVEADVFFEAIFGTATGGSPPVLPKAALLQQDMWPMKTDREVQP